MPWWMDRDFLLEMFAPDLSEEQLAAYSLSDLQKLITGIRDTEPDDLPLSDREIARILYY